MEFWVIKTLYKDSNITLPLQICLAEGEHTRLMGTFKKLIILV